MIHVLTILLFSFTIVSNLSQNLFESPVHLSVVVPIVMCEGFCGFPLFAKLNIRI